MTGPVTIGIDVGTTNVKVALVEVAAAPRVLATASVDHPTTRPRPGWVEQSPPAWWEATCRALHALGPRVAEAAGVSISGQGSTVTLCGPAGEDPSPAISWQDLRAADDAAALDRGLRTMLDRAHGNRTGDAPEPKLRWLREHEPALVARADRALTAAAWIQARLGGDGAITEADAGAWMSWHRHRRAWDDEIAARMGVAELLPPAARTGAHAGRVSDAAARESGLPAGTPIVIGTSDVAAAAVSAGVGAPGEVAFSKGTGGFACCYVEPLADPGALLALPGIDPAALQLCGATNAVGSAWDWARAMLGGVAHDEAERLAETAGPSGAPVFVPWLAGAGHPLQDQRALAAFAGLSLETSRGGLLRAVLEGTAAELGHQLSVARAVTGRGFDLIVSTGGPTRSSLWNRLDAAATGTPVVVAPLSDAAVGCALIAAEAEGLVDSAVGSGRALRGEGHRYEPEPELCERAGRTAEALERVRAMALELA